jgi:drug/metabolite transporter (DMT)-like permease
VPITRALFAAAIQILIVITFSFAAEGGVNAGIVSSIFTTSVIFSSIIFYCKYGQKLSYYDAVGITLVIVCVALISSSGSKSSEEETNEYKIYSILMAVLVGLTFSLNSVDLHHGMKLGFSAYQMNTDGNLFFGLMLLPFYAHEVV